MRLMRNTSPNGQCKYALVRMDKAAMLPLFDDKAQVERIKSALKTLEDEGLLENPKPGDPEEFFAIKLKDPRSTRALDAYADAAQPTDPEFANEVRQLAERSGEFSPFRKEPD